jgi:pimeloyl-ACP methyl ester carboxylesterase
MLEAELGINGAGPAYRLLYTSTDGNSGRDIVAVSGALFLPAGKPPQGGWPLVAWAHGTVGIADICAPSVQGRSLRDVTYLRRWLSEGFAVVATDYQGLGVPGPHLYLNTRSEAYSVIDSIRAAEQGFPNLSHQAIIVGQSQGGQAAFAAAVFAGKYAPDLPVKAVVATGTPDFTTVEDLRRNFLDNPFQGDYDPTVYDTLFLLAMAKQHDPALELAKVIEPAAMDLFNQSRSVCSARLEFDIEGSGLTRHTAFKPGKVLETLLPYVPTFGYLDFKSNIPIFMGIGAKDEEVPYQGLLTLVSKACAAGTVIEAHLYANTGHSGAVNGSIADSLAFVRNISSGRPIAKNCAPKPQ